MKKSKIKPAPAKRHHSVACFFTSFFITLAVFGTVAGVIIVDSNTRHIGWNTDSTALAFSSQSKRLNLTVFGGSYVIDFGAMQKAAAVYGKARDSFSRIAPAPGRFCGELLQLADTEVLNLYEKYLNKPL